MQIKTCETCRYFSALNQVCLRFPPYAVAIPRGVQLQVLGLFPPTKKENFCGEYAFHPEQDETVKILRVD